MSLEQRTILIVDDNQAEIEMLKEAVDEVYPQFTLLAVMSGKDCLAVLRRSGQWKDADQPDLILLDLNMPAIDGRTVLAEIKNDPELRHIPVIILTTSRAEKDVMDSYRRYANSYVVKSLDYDDLRMMVQEMLHYWLHIARIPAPC